MITLARRVARWAAGAAVAFGIVACSERLVTPGDCPTLCPGGELRVLDTVLYPLEGLDSSFQGYVERGGGEAVLAGDRLDGQSTKVYFQFGAVPDSLILQDTARAFVVDSVSIIIGLVARDTAVRDLRLRLYKLPATIDSSASYATLAAAFTPEALVDSVAVADTLRSGAVRLLLKEDALERIAFEPEDERVLRLGVEVAASAPTGARLGTGNNATVPTIFVAFVTAAIADTALQRQQITRQSRVATWATEFPDPPQAEGTLLVGRAPSYRTLVRFPFPLLLRDSASLVAARLELDPVSPVLGLPSDTARLELRAIVSDLGAKSPLLPNVGATQPLPVGTAASVGINVTRLVAQWQSPARRPPSLLILLQPEAASFSQPVFGSSLDPARRPRLRVSYVQRFPFESP